MSGGRSDLRRRVPSVDGLLRSEPGRRASASLGRPLVKRALTLVLDEVRASASRGHVPPADDEILARAAHLASSAATGLRPVINATGVILHTNLGRAPLPGAAAAAVAETAASSSDLEVDRETGRRGTRSARVELLVTALTGADAALVVNNCAAALLLALAALAARKDVLVSRGELIEIGGEFRIPDIVAASGAKLAEVGTTNRTRVRDFEEAVGPRTGAILRVHPSNYRIVGFTAAPRAASLAALAHRHGLVFVHDVGSGLLRDEPGVLRDEPSVAGALSDGADLVTCSGDKLLGGPQAGIIAGGRPILERLRRHPMARAVRVDKMQLAALEAVLGMVATGRGRDVPVRAMLTEPAASIRRRAGRMLDDLVAGGTPDAGSLRVVRTRSVVGGGSLPGTELPSWGLEIAAPDAAELAERLRGGTPSVFGRSDEGRLVLDLRTVLPAQHDDLARALRRALEGPAGT